jgi:succinylglutamate desuccinylase
VQHVEIESTAGHDSFLVDHAKQTPYIEAFLRRLDNARTSAHLLETAPTIKIPGREREVGGGERTMVALS